MNKKKRDYNCNPITYGIQFVNNMTKNELMKTMKDNETEMQEELKMHEKFNIDGSINEKENTIIEFLINEMRTSRYIRYTLMSMNDDEFKTDSPDIFMVKMEMPNDDIDRIKNVALYIHEAIGNVIQINCI